MKSILAMWSGPRNISTAMMRAWENRPDCVVWDEPFYAAYLQDSGLSHPVREQILQHHERDWRKVAQQCCTPPAGEAEVFYQKHMTQHLLANYSRDWMQSVQHCFLLRHPRDVLRSYALKRTAVSLTDIGIQQQRALFETVCSFSDKVPLVIDSADFLCNPHGYLQAICAHYEIPFYTSMLQWPAGQRSSDGVWAAHWYERVWTSTGFDAARDSDERPLAPHLQTLLQAALPDYSLLYEHALKIPT